MSVLWYLATVIRGLLKARRWLIWQQKPYQTDKTDIKASDRSC